MIVPGMGTDDILILESIGTFVGLLLTVLCFFWSNDENLSDVSR